MCVRIAIKVAYFNTLEIAHGFQIQSNVETIQGFLIQAITKTEYVDKLKFKLAYAGRTDNGVNALCQVIAFDLNSEQKKVPPRFLYQINNELPNNIRCWAYSIVPNDFSPRFDAIQRKYTYVWFDSKLSTINLNEMQKSASLLTGKNNYINFAKKDNADQNTIRQLSNIDISFSGNYLVFHLIGKSFLWQQCRRIVSHLLQVGYNESSVAETIQLLSDSTSQKKPEPISPEFLILSDIQYENIYFTIEKSILQKMSNLFLELVNRKTRELSFTHKFLSILSKTTISNS